ncbi:hypothetical protein [Alkalihalobacterium chitinilyticum]|uniref:Uncharacterized protein n=1 Tax=Alkalihalobacterium chitinilyticum TaxID=2980103 RepID=A0ABT5VBM1_9BACI|nr:hypothetical protein [Alkalihalobacterium chitinilyticum]MDE5411853.1 hypothetical protein [Alkalihalobacterium chitinilyticum]
MNKDELIQQLTEKQLDDIIELIEDAEGGYLEELELVESLGLVHDGELNTRVIELLKSLGVKIIYVTDDE